MDNEFVKAINYIIENGCDITDGECDENCPLYNYDADDRYPELCSAVQLFTNGGK